MLSSRNSKAVAPTNLQNTVVTCMKRALMEEGHPSLESYRSKMVAEG